MLGKEDLIKLKNLPRNVKELIDNLIVKTNKQGDDIENINSQLDIIANKGTTVEVLERVTKQEIDRQIADGTIANLTIANNSITAEKYKDKSITIAKLSDEISNALFEIEGVDSTQFNWAMGVFNFIGKDGTPSSSTTRIYTTNNVFIKKGTKIRVKEGYSYGFILYDPNNPTSAIDNASSWLTGEYIAPRDGLIKISMKYSNNNSITSIYSVSQNLITASCIDKKQRQIDKLNDSIKDINNNLHVQINDGGFTPIQLEWVQGVFGFVGNDNDIGVEANSRLRIRTKELYEAKKGSTVTVEGDCKFGCILYGNDKKTILQKSEAWQTTPFVLQADGFIKITVGYKDDRVVGAENIAYMSSCITFKGISESGASLVPLKTIVSNLIEEVDDIKENGTSNSNFHSHLSLQGLANQLQGLAKRLINIEQLHEEFKLPVLKLSGDMNGMSKDKSKTLSAEFYDGVMSFKSLCKVKWQGATSTSFPKKNFNVKFVDKAGNKYNTCFKDWYATNSYHMKANYYDYSLVRNNVGVEWGRSLLEKQYPNNARGVIDGFPFIMYINEEFWGCYTWNLKQDEELFAMDVKNENHMAFRPEDIGWFVDRFELRCPDVQTDHHTDRLKRMVDWSTNCTNEDFKNNVSNYFDLDSLINYWLFMDIGCCGDSMVNNSTWATWDGNIWYVLWYDLDICFGQNSSLYKSTTDLIEMSKTTYTKKFNPVWVKLNDNFFDLLCKRYTELRKTQFKNAECIIKRFTDYQDNWGEYLAQEYSKWNGKPNKTDDIKNKTNWINERLKYLDNKYGYNK